MKKGQTVYEVTPWDFLGFGMQRNQNFYRDEKGRCIYSEKTVDTIMIQEWVIYSIGKKQMYLINPANSQMARRLVRVYDDMPYFTDKEEGIKVQTEKWNNDTTATKPGKLEFKINPYNK